MLLICANSVESAPYWDFCTLGLCLRLCWIFHPPQWSLKHHLKVPFPRTYTRFCTANIRIGLWLQPFNSVLWKRSYFYFPSINNEKRTTNVCLEALEMLIDDGNNQQMLRWKHFQRNKKWMDGWMNGLNDNGCFLPKISIGRTKIKIAVCCSGTYISGKRCS